MKIVFKKYLFLLTPLFLFSNDDFSQLQESLINTKLKKSQIDAKLEKDSWIGSFNLSASHNKNVNEEGESSSQSLSLSFNQDLFKSGGIKYGILKGENLASIALLESKKKIAEISYMIFTTVLNINKIDLQIEKNKLSIKNKQLQVLKNEDKYINGLIAINDLNDAMIELNNLLDSQEDLQDQKKEYINTLKIYSSKQYIDIKLNKMKLINEKDFILHNSNLKELDLKQVSSKYDSKITVSNYLPKLSFSASYSQNSNLDDSTMDDSHNYGLTLSVPLDFKASKKIESSKLNVLLSKNEYSKKIIEERNFFKKKINTINTINKKILNKNKNIKSYEKVYEMTKSLFENTIKSEDDLITSLNRLKVSMIELKILELNKQINIFDLYKKIVI